MNQLDRHFYIINLFSLGFYAIIVWNLGIGLTEVLFFTEDARSYWDVSQWLMGGEENMHIVRRPILYPLILLTFRSIGGDTGIWFIHLIFWLLTINLTFRSVFLLTKNRVYAYIGAVLILMNLSLIAFTMHALAELTCTFMVSLLVYYFIKNISRRKEPAFIHGCLLLLGLLTILKPVFFIPALLVLFVITPLFYGKNYLIHPKKLWTLLLVLLPLVLQITIVKYQSGKIAISEIGSLTFTNYFLTQGIQKHEKIERMKAMGKAQKLSSSEKRKYLMKHSGIYFNLYISNLIDNFRGCPSFLTFPNDPKHNPFRDFMKKLNGFFYYVHLLFIFIIPVFLSLLAVKKDYENIVLIAGMSALCAYLFLVSGISFHQGDRLILPTIPLWISLYLSTIFKIRKSVIGNS